MWEGEGGVGNDGSWERKLTQGRRVHCERQESGKDREVEKVARDNCCLEHPLKLIFRWLVYR